MKIFTVRHGQTPWNVQRRIQGHTDIALDETGLLQAEKIGKRFANEKIDIIYSSDLSRAAKTAQAIGRHHNAEIVLTPDLRERNLGEFEGRFYHEISQELDHYNALKQPLPGGESSDQAFCRISSVLAEALSTQHKTIVIVGHHGTVLNVMRFLLQASQEEAEMYHIGNTAIHCFQRKSDGVFHMTIENDMSHLD